MHAEKLTIRKARPEDCEDILRWRNDPHSAAMFLDTREIPAAEHRDWYFNALSNSNICMYVAECCACAVGICRFEVDVDQSFATIAINLDPGSRGKGLGLDLLVQSCESFLTDYAVPLLAEVKQENVASVKLFLSAGFKEGGDANGILRLEKKPGEISFKSVATWDAGLLYRLLQKRKCNISHRKMPSYESHYNFVRNNPYLHWYIVYDLAPIGSFYVKSDNSVGLNLMSLDRRYIAAILNFISRELTPLGSVPSMVAENYFINVAYENHGLRRALIESGLNPIQVSYELGGEVKDV
ncbi:GNAT family N-acetyltransferase [Luminiphilus sp.]|nr:GNAT family N-acetyltransferase [Luminiphilus sp.]